MHRVSRLTTYRLKFKDHAGFKDFQGLEKLEKIQELSRTSGTPDIIPEKFWDDVSLRNITETWLSLLQINEKAT